MEVGRRRVGVAAVGGQHQGATLGGAEGAVDHGQGAAVDIGVVGIEVQGGAERHVLGHADRIVHGHRRVIHRGNGQTDSDSVNAALAVADHHDEAVAAVVVWVRRVGPGTVGRDADAAMRRVAALRVAQGVAVRIGSGELTTDRRVFCGNDCKVAADRDIIAK
ncbi:hypothetical protein D3C80_1617990 [compost metagenome]